MEWHQGISNVGMLRWYTSNKYNAILLQLDMNSSLKKRESVFSFESGSPSWILLFISSL